MLDSNPFVCALAGDLWHIIFQKASASFVSHHMSLFIDEILDATELLNAVLLQKKIDAQLESRCIHMLQNLCWTVTTQLNVFHISSVLHDNLLCALYRTWI